jgi:predicted nucleic-acid-binding protein
VGAQSTAIRTEAVSFDIRTSRVIALDTNVLLRYLTDDDQTLAARAQVLIRDNRCFVSRVVLLETYQVLESYYQLDQATIVKALHTIFGLDTISVEDHLATARAVEWYEQGMEFPDALALASAHQQDSFATFDRDFARVAAKLGAKPPVSDSRR